MLLVATSWEHARGVWGGGGGHLRMGGHVPCLCGPAGSRGHLRASLRGLARLERTTCGPESRPTSTELRDCAGACRPAVRTEHLAFDSEVISTGWQPSAAAVAGPLLGGCLMRYPGGGYQRPKKS